MVASVISPDPIRWQIAWSAIDPAATNTAASATEGQLTLMVEEEDVWPASDFTWTWIELLEWLGDSWPWLCGEDGLPFCADPETTEDLRRWLHQEYRLSSTSERDRAELALWDFLAVHDLSQAVKGAQPPAVVVWREGLVGHVLTDTRHVRTSWTSVRRSLEALGWEIHTRLEPLRGDARAEAAREAWESRDSLSTQDLLSAAGVPELLADRVTALGSLGGPGAAARKDLNIERNEILAAARMSAGLPTSVTAAILERIVAIPKVSTAEIDAVTNRVQETAELPTGAQPFEEGYAFAEAFRRVHGLSDEDAFAPAQWLTRVGVRYDEVDLGTGLVDAVAAWGETHGPAVVINVSGRHARSARGRNASIAHEIGHLLLDREGALSAVEVLGGLVNPRVESRARAFAAEVLLPRGVAGRVFSEADAGDSTEHLVLSLAARYGVSKELVAWQARNSGVRLHDTVVDHLRNLVREPHRF